MIRMKGDHRARTPSYFAAADRLPYPNATQLASLAVAAGACSGVLGHASAVDPRNDALT
jgi:hypothetical protein